MADVSMRILLSATGGGAVTSVINDIARSLGKGGGLDGAIAGIGLSAVGMAVGLGVTAVNAAASFQDEMTQLVTGAGEMQSNLGLVSNGILDLATATGDSTDQLAQGMYMIESAGYHGAAGLDALKAAAEAAKVGNADLGTVANAETTLMTDYAKSHINADQAVNALITTVASGKTHMQDLATALASVAPTAAASSISLNDMMGALATMTGEGVPAADAATYLRQTIIALMAPSKQTTKALADVGLTTQQVADAMQQSMPDALKMITDAVGKKFPEGSAQYIQALKDIAGGSKQMQGILDLTGDHMATFSANSLQVGHDVYWGSQQVKGWTEVQGDFNTKIDQAKEVIQTLLIKLGTNLLPILTNIASNVIPIIQRFADWITNTKNLDSIHKALQPTLDAVAGVFKVLTQNIIPLIQHIVEGVQHSGALQQAFGMIATVVPQLINFFKGFVEILAKVGNWLMNNQAAFTFLKILILAIAGVIIVVLGAALATVIIGMTAVAIVIGVVVGVIVGIIWVIQHWGQIWGAVVGFVQGIWNAFTSWLGNTLKSIGQFFTNIWNDVTTGIKNFFVMIGSWIQARIADIVGFFKGLWDGAVSMWNGMIDGIKDAIHAGFEWVKNTIEGAINNVVNLFHWLYEHNYYFQHLVDAIRHAIEFWVNWFKNAWQDVVTWVTNLWQSIVKIATTVWNAVIGAIKAVINAVVNWFKSTWNTVTTWLHNLWQSIVGIATTVWNAISGAISSAVTAVWNWLVGVWNTIIGWLSQQWNKLSGFATTAWNNVVGVFKGVWNSISGALGDLWNNISGWFGNLANQAIQWGKNLITGFINGVKGMLGDVGKTMGDVAGTIGKFLGFHSPAKEGPGSEADVWAPNLIKMFAAGLTNALPTLQTSLALVMRPVGNTLSGQGLGPGAVGRPTGSTVIGGHTFNITLQTNFAPNQQQARQAVDMIEQELGRRVRSQTPGYNQGGVF